MTDTTKTLLISELSAIWGSDSSMIKYCMGKISDVVFLENGDFITIEKPLIKTRFCFGYGMIRGYESAEDCAAYARKSVEHFMSENLDNDLSGWIEILKDSNTPIYTAVKYHGSKEDTKYKDILYYAHGFGYTKGVGKTEEPQPITEKDRENLLKAFENAQNKFIKRLNIKDHLLQIN